MQVKTINTDLQVLIKIASRMRLDFDYKPKPVKLNH